MRSRYLNPAGCPADVLTGQGIEVRVSLLQSGYQVRMPGRHPDADREVRYL